MTKEQKINWLENATNETLLKQFETCSKEASDPFTYSKRQNRKFDEIFEDYELVKAEIFKRMSK